MCNKLRQKHGFEFPEYDRSVSMSKSSKLMWKAAVDFLDEALVV